MPSPDAPAWVNLLALRVADDAAPEAMRARLAGAGLDVIGPVDHGGCIRSICFLDPDGLPLELTTEVASAATVQSDAREARAALDAWTRARSDDGRAMTGVR